MGADWYTFTSFSALGFIVGAKKWAAMKFTPSYPYDYVFFSSDFDQTPVVQVFIYDVRTATKSNVSVVGPYDIEASFHSTTVAKNNLAFIFLQLPTCEMNSAFGTTAVEFQTVCSTQSIEKCASINEYCSYCFGQSSNSADSESAEAESGK